jgi:hypothetical protein
MQTTKRKSLIVVISSGCGFIFGLLATVLLLDFGFRTGLPFAIVSGLSLTYLIVSFVVRGAML